MPQSYRLSALCQAMEPSTQWRHIFLKKTCDRQSFRVPTTECLDLVAHFEFGGVPLEGIVLDISNGGLCADLLSIGKTGLKRGDRGKLVLHYQSAFTENEVVIRDIRKSIVHLAYVMDDERKLAG